MGTQCKACGGKGEISLPVEETTDLFNCPCCRPWIHGFGGLGTKKNGEWFWFIEPAAPNTPARYIERETWASSIQPTISQ